MALQLLLIFILLNLTHEAKAEGLPQPNLTVDRLVMTENDSVTLNCSAPPHVSVSRCDFYIENKEMSANSSCVKTLTGSEMMRILNRKSPADVKVKCSYVKKNDPLNAPSSASESTTITINNLLPSTLIVNPLVITKSDSVTLNCQPPSSVPVTDCYFHIGKGETSQRFSCLKMLTGAELLSLTKQSSPANIDVTCFYLKSHPSPKSNLLTIIIELPPPELTVNPQQITETDSVTVDCGTPSSVSVENCVLYFINSKMSRSISCEETLTGRDLLMMTHQTSPAEVELKCFYNVKSGGLHQSPDSNTSTITIQNVQETDSTTSKRVTTVSVTAGNTSSVSIQNVQETDSTTSQRVTTVGVTAGQTFRTTTMKTESPFSPPPSSVNYPSGSTTVNTLGSVSTLSMSPSEAPADQELSDKLKWMYVAVPGFGVVVGVVLLVGLLCSRWRSDKTTYTRSRVGFNDNFIGMKNVTNGGLSPVGDEDHHRVTFVPADDSATKSVALNTQNSHNENHDVYHVYSTIPDEPEEPTIVNELYYTLQAH